MGSVVINFRYHIVSLMAVFLALSVGIVVGVTLGPSVGEGLAGQAAQDRKQVQDLRTELDRRNQLDEYRNAWAQGVGDVVTADALAGEQVTIITMPEAPRAVTQALADAVTKSGGTVASTAAVNDKAFDPDRAAEVAATLAPVTPSLPEDAAVGTQLGSVLSRALLAPQSQDRVPGAREAERLLTRTGLVTFDGKAEAAGSLAVVVTAEAPDPRPTPDLLSEHVAFETALKSSARGVVVAGPNSAEIEGSDVLAVRNNLDAVRSVSTVDVADLPAGVLTTVLAGQEQLLGRTGHYGALTDADGPLPELPVR